MPSPVPMGYGREMSGIRPKGKGLSSTVELMAGTGLKYVHAIGKGKYGSEGDLERSRNMVLSKT